ncbi:hypothetical protein F5Y15DRAFT_403886 [Xylariaceae sp. FL0016]|nr:hypothetical protein F5Y15DRAFT_403886 [Xylariaceae sp. FL0016]
MASTSSEITRLERAISQLLNKQLQTICATHGLRTSGVKAELQNRIKLALIENAQADPANYQLIRNTILNLTGDRTGQSSHLNFTNMAGSSSTINGSAYGQSSNKPQYGGYSQGGSYQSPPSSHGYGNGPAGGGGGYKAANSRDIQFKPSPFYNIDSKIGETQICDVMSQHRNSVRISIRASDHQRLSQCGPDKPYRVLLFCAGDNQGVQDIAFPHQSEIKINGGDVKANLRGLKGKPGSTRPVDITRELRLKQFNYQNNIEFTYALTNKKFYLAIFVCKMVSIEDLVGRIKGKKIPKASVIAEFNKKANDPDIEATSTGLSLTCPLTYEIMKVPCRSISCTHVQCFDANSYLLLQEQGPQWLCPICKNAAPFENLAVDEYVRQILEKTSYSLEQVTVEPNGQWRTQAAAPEPTKSHYSGAGVSDHIDDDDDALVITDYQPRLSGGPSGRASFGGNHMGTPNQYHIGSTPASSSREASNAPRSGSKRPLAEVIDLTLSSDEDDEPIRPPKKQYQGSNYGDSAGGGLSFPSSTARY